MSEQDFMGGASVQNIYDDETFHAAYLEYRESDASLNAAAEQPALMRLLPRSLAGLRVLDMGCGTGQFAQFACEQAAAHVSAFDVSHKMLAEARARTDTLRIEYRRLAIEDFATRPFGEFDLVVSSLALHYVQDYAAAVRAVRSVLAPGGCFVFSVEHPIVTAVAVQRWHEGPKGEILHWPVDDYRDEGERRHRWFVDGVIKYHRTVATYVNTLLDVGFDLARLEEPEPEPAAVSRFPPLARYRRRPPYLILAAHIPK